MKIKLLCDLPVEEKHGLVEGRVLEVVHTRRNWHRPRWWVMGDAGREIGVLGREAKEVEQDSFVFGEELRWIRSSASPAGRK